MGTAELQTEPLIEHLEQDLISPGSTGEGNSLVTKMGGAWLHPF